VGSSETHAESHTYQVRFAKQELQRHVKVELWAQETGA